MSTTDAPAPVAGDAPPDRLHTLIAIDQLVTERPNGHDRLEAKKIEELRASIASHGVLNALIVRPLGTAVAPGAGFEVRQRYDVVAGRRRLAAAVFAGLTEVPCQVRHLTDAEAEQVQIIENLQRLDLHPLDEAEHFHKLVTDHGLTFSQCADQVGKSVAYVRQRAKLMALESAIRDEFRRGRIDAGGALAFARIDDPKTRKRAWNAFAERFAYAEHVDADDVTGFLEREVMLDLARAPFDVADATLLEGVPACGECTKRSGNDLQLFGDVSSENLCTDSACFEKKRAAGWKAARVMAEEAGHTVIEGKDARPLFIGSSLRADAELVDLDVDVEWQGKTRKCRGLVGKHVEGPLTVVQAPDGRALECITRKQLRSAMKRAGLAEPRKPVGDGPSERERAKQEREKEIERQRAAQALALAQRAAVVTAFEREGGPESLVRLALPYLIEVSNEVALEEVARRRGLKPIPDGVPRDPGVWLRDFAGLIPFDRAQPKRLAALFLEVLLAHVDYEGDGPSMLKAFAKSLKLDLSKIKPTAQASVEVLGAPKPAPESAGESATKDAAPKKLKRPAARKRAPRPTRRPALKRTTKKPAKRGRR